MTRWPLTVVLSPVRAGERGAGERGAGEDGQDDKAEGRGPSEKPKRAFHRTSDLRPVRSTSLGSNDIPLTLTLPPGGERG
jgi:hypothetical protein